MKLQNQFLRYLLVGGAGTLVHLLILAFTVEIFSRSATTGTILGFCGALFVSFTLNHKWTFDTKRSRLNVLWRYVLVSVFGLILNVSMVNGLVNSLGWWYLWAQLSVIWVVPITNFLLNKYWSFGNANNRTLD